MATTGCCDLIRNMGDSRSTDDGDLPIINGNNIPTSPTIEYPKGSVNSGPSSIIHRSRGHKRTKSAGNNSLRDFSLYTATGLYAHQPGNKNLRLYSSSNLPIKTSSELNIYELLASNHYKNSVEINSGHQLNIEQQQNGVQTEREQTLNCGFMSFRPKCLQRFATIQAFVFFSCILVTFQQALSSGYFNSVITTIEKRFDMPSKISGAIVSTFELGNLLTIIFVSYFGTHRHIPHWIGKGIVITGIGSLVFAIPHFMDINNPLDNVNVSGPVSDNTCRIPTPALSSPILEKASHFINPSAPINDPTCVEGGTYNAPHILIFMLAMVLIGCGGTPIFTLGTIYIDDHVKKESSSMYIGCMYSMVAFGLVCGFLLGGYFIQVHENSFGSGTVPLDIFPGHPKFIGAWWSGFILLGLLLILISIPFFAFPKSLKPKIKEKHVRCLQSEVVDEQIHRPKFAITESPNNTLRSVQNQARSPHPKHKYGRNIKEIPSCMWRLLTNPVYMTTCLGSCMELAIVSGFLVFLPKYLETQFSLGKSQANLFAGGIAVPGACVGIFLGGYLLKKFQMKPKGAIQFVLFFNLVCMGLYTALYFLGCDNVRMAGTTLPYANNTRFDAFKVNLTADCNMGCRCSPNELEPVCDTQNKISYYSPCFAGCKSAEGPQYTQNYSNCACISLNMTYQNNQEVTAVPLATAGPCPQMCQAMIPFMILLFVITLVVSITQMPLLMITLRSVEEEERSLALGMQFVIFRLFGYIPSPIIFGNVIDSTCLVWKAHCGQEGGFCLLYNIEQFRLRYVGVCSGLKVAAGLLFFLDWLLICWRHKKDLDKPQALTVGEIVSSIISLDRLSVFGWNTNIKEDDEEQQPLGPDSDYNSANDPDEQELNENEEFSTIPQYCLTTNQNIHFGMSRV